MLDVSEDVAGKPGDDAENICLLAVLRLVEVLLELLLGDGRRRVGMEDLCRGGV